MKSTTQHQFSQIPRADIQRSTFNRDHGYKTTFNAGDLIPFYLDEVLPGDTFSVNATMFARLATPIYPIMDNIFIDCFYFFVPHRLVWTNWVNFMGEEEAPGDYVNSVVSYLTPQVTTPAGGYAEGSLADYFGIPTKVTGILPETRPEGVYGDFTDPVLTNYQEAKNIVIGAQELFDALPARTRERFANDPVNLIAFVQDENNREEAYKLGLLRDDYKSPSAPPQTPTEPAK